LGRNAEQYHSIRKLIRAHRVGQYHHQHHCRNYHNTSAAEYHFSWTAFKFISKRNYPGWSFSGTLAAGTLNNITALGNLSALTVSGNITTSTIAGTITTPAQPNITSVGQLSNLSVSGTIQGGAFSGTLAAGTFE
jgi:hypothetical protein